MDDDSIATVAMVTGGTPELAAQYLQLADGDANQAVQLFFENGGADLSGGASAQTAPPQAPLPGNAQNPIDLDNDENVSDDNDPEITGYRRTAPAPVEDDEALARRLQQEMYGGAGGEEPVRAPIARQSETLVGPDADALPMTHAEMDAAVQARMEAMQRRRGQGKSRFTNTSACKLMDY